LPCFHSTACQAVGEFHNHLFMLVGEVIHGFVSVGMVFGTLDIISSDIFFFAFNAFAWVVG
ncbi:MAG: hypothetical protein ABUK13_08815, partial [Gammaproteobacteria bacterium]